MRLPSRWQQRAEPFRGRCHGLRINKCSNRLCGYSYGFWSQEQAFEVELWKYVKRISRISGDGTVSTRIADVADDVALEAAASNPDTLFAGARLYRAT